MNNSCFNSHHLLLLQFLTQEQEKVLYFSLTGQLSSSFPSRGNSVSVQLPPIVFMIADSDSEDLALCVSSQCDSLQSVAG